MILVALLKLAAALAVLIWSGGLLTGAVTRLSGALGLSSFVVSFVLITSATTVPELTVAVIAALRGTGALALGTVIGSNICNIALVVGACLLISGGFSLQGVVSRREVAWAAAISLLPLLLALDGVISRLDGALLLAAFGLYLYHLLRAREVGQRLAAVRAERGLGRGLGLLVVSVAVLVLASHFTVKYAVETAELLAVPVFLIGLFAVAVGTSLPELVFGVRASLSGDPTASAGNVTGSLIFNASLIIGLSALAGPIVIHSRTEYLVSAAVLTALLGFLLAATHTDRLLTRRWGIALLAVYAVFLLLEWGRT